MCERFFFSFNGYVAQPLSTPTLIGGKVIASPLALTVAKEKGLDLLSLTIIGTGPDGRMIIADNVREDVPVAATEATPAQTSTAVPATIAAPIIGESYTDEIYKTTRVSLDMFIITGSKN